jgi:hypothetical protein
MVFIAGPPPYGDPERNQILQLHDPALRAVLAPLPRDTWDAVTEAWDRGDYQRTVAEQAVGKSQQRTKPRSDPATHRRRTGAQEWMLEHYAQIGRLEEVLDELDEIIQTDPQRRVAILGAGKAIGRETLRRYWKQIPTIRRATAKQAFELLPEPERNARLARRRTDRLTR